MSTNSSPLDWACGRCDSQPGEQCKDMPLNTFHDERWMAWGAHNQVSEPASKEDFDKAVEDSGLV